MKPREDCNGDEGAAMASRGGGSEGSEAGAQSDDSSGSGSGSEAAELSLEDRGAPARALAALNALRKSRQHYDVLLVGGGAEVPAHRALLAAASPHLLRELGGGAGGGGGGGELTYRVEGVSGEALRALVEYAYTGRLAVGEAGAARRLYAAAASLRVEPVRAHLADRLLRRLTPADCLLARALPALEPHHLRALDAYIAEHFDEVCASGALATLPLVRIEMLKATSAEEGRESPRAVASAALVWLRDHNETATLEELCARTHLVFVDAAGALRDCEQLPAARGDAHELHEYRRAAAGRRPRAARDPADRPSPDHAVLAARGAAPPGVTRALLALGGRLAAARLAWRDVAGGARGGPLGGGEARAALGEGRAALGGAALAGRLVVCGGYDRARVLRAAHCYEPASNAWAALPAMRSARARFPAARLGRRLYALGGSDGHNELDSVDVLEEAGGGAGGGGEWAWRARARLPAPVSHAGAAAHEEGGALYVVGGWAGGRSLRQVHRYRPDEDKWVEAPPLLTGRSQCASVVWAGALWALGGCDAWHCLASTETLPLAAGDAAWRPGPALPTARRSVGGAAWRGALVSVGGSDGAASLRRCDWLAAPGGAWQPGPALRTARAALALAELQDVLYAVGGFDGKEFLASVECLYAPDGQWTELCCPPAPRPAPATPPAHSEEDAKPPAEEQRPNGRVAHAL